MEILGNNLKRFFNKVDNPPNDATITYAGKNMKCGKYQTNYSKRYVTCQKKSLLN